MSLTRIHYCGFWTPTHDLAQRPDKSCTTRQDVVSKTLDCKAINEMHDRQIVATALLAQSNGSQVAILTKDGNIEASGLVQTIWS
jgi:hypothetical protein